MIKQIKEKEGQVTSVIHTVDEINKILELYGFINFSIKEASKKGYYKIVRQDGSDVKDTLSEGEYTFITFLYFYQLIKGSTQNSGQTRDKIVVIDDPISSLDSNVLFIVSTLVKNVIQDCFDGKDGIKQVIILTHNIYFYKEITFRGNSNSKSDKETFWVVRKNDNISRIESHEENPIKTTYELLWKDLHDSRRDGRATVFNTMRRILEYYFNITGGLNYEKFINEFEGEEKLLCKSLISFINDGSHYISDDLAVCFDEDMKDKYLLIFRLIFEKTGHSAHYNMMSQPYLSNAEVLAELASSMEI